MNNFLYLVGNLMLLAAIPPANLFVIFYATRSRWRELLAGRSLMYVFVAVSAVLDYNASGVLHNLTTPPPSFYGGQVLVRIVLYALLDFGFWRMFITLLHVQSAKRSGDLPEGDVLAAQLRHKR